MKPQGDWPGVSKQSSIFVISCSTLPRSSLGACSAPPVILASDSRVLGCRVTSCLPNAPSSLPSKHRSLLPENP
eukprot:2230754-Prymnesium_polylepis.1